MRREYDKASLIPEELVNRMTKASSDAFMAWQEAKSNSDMNSFLPHLRALIDLTKEKISYLGVESTPYDVLLDDYEVGMGVKDYDPFFSNIRQRLVPLFQARFNPVLQKFLSGLIQLSYPNRNRNYFVKM